MLSKTETKEAKTIAENADVLIAILLGLKTSSRRFTYDKATNTFTDGEIRITPPTLRNFVERIQKAGGVRVREHTDAFLRGEIGVDDWRIRTGTTIVASHLLSSALALGSLITAKTDEDTVRRIGTELNYLDNFKNDITRKQLSGAKINARAKSYMLAVGVTYHRADQRNKASLRLGTKSSTSFGQRVTSWIYRKLYGEVRRVRRASESCASCVAYAGIWMPIEEMPPIGSLTCGSRCKCYLEYR